MKTAISLLLSLDLFACAVQSYAMNTPPSPSPDKDDGWLQNGKPVPDSDNIKSKNGFGAQLWIIHDRSFFDDWNKPGTPDLPITETVMRNKPVFIVFLFINPGLDQESRAHVTADVTIRSPDGKMYGDFKDIEIWRRRYAAPRNGIQLAVDNLGLKIEDGEQLGVYQIEATITDHIAKTTLELKTAFTAKEK